MDKALQEKIGERIRVARERLGLHQEDLAKQLGLKRTTITSYEMGKSSPHITDLPLLAQVLSVSILYFFESQPEDSNSASG